MLRYAARRLLFSIPTLLVISFIVFALLDLAPERPDRPASADDSPGDAADHPREP